MIRPMRSDDRALYLAMIGEYSQTGALLHPLPRAYHERNFDEIVRPDGLLRGVVLEDGGEAAGFAQYTFAWATEAGGRCLWVEDVYVRAAHRGRGLARAFFAWLDTEYGGAVRRFRLEVEPDNVRAAALYRDLGFEPLPYMQMVRGRTE